MSIIADASGASLHPFVTANIEPGATVITNGWNGYQRHRTARLQP
jgi:hypothetical protein